MGQEPRYLPSGDRALTVELGDSISPETNRRVHNLMRALETRNMDGVLDLVPSYRSLLVHYDPLTLSLSHLKEELSALNAAQATGVLNTPRVVHVPTLYGGHMGPDLDHVAQHNNLTVDEVISIHCGTDYLVYMLGFSPGFPYLGGMSESIATPRLDTPRLAIPAGSVGIAESQTGIYPTETPGGWQLIGRTPLQFFDPYRQPPSLVEPGDYLRFVSINEDDYESFQAQVEEGAYQLVVKEKG
jgi:inhibitor of KinA